MLKVTQQSLVLYPYPYIVSAVYSISDSFLHSTNIYQATSLSRQ